jgi:hypothetical protein
MSSRPSRSTRRVKKQQSERQQSSSMRKTKRVGSTSLRLSQRAAVTTRKKTAASGARLMDRLIETGGTFTEDLRLVRFAGVSLGGGKTDKTSVAILEYYPDRKRVFLRSLFEKVSAKGEETADDVLEAILLKEAPGLWGIAFDAPLQLPTCVRCDDPCPGPKSCEKDVFEWMRKAHAKRGKSKRPNKMFTPYTERACEIWIANELEEEFHPSHALGANAAPLAARAHCLQRRLAYRQSALAPNGGVTPFIEVYPKLSLWRMGRDLDVPKSHLRFHKHAVDSDESRHSILKTLIDKQIAFIYQQDLKTMVENSSAFDAFLCAMTAFLKSRGQTEKRPSDFPKGEIWIDFPIQNIKWF